MDRPAMNGQTEEDVGASCEHVFDQFVTAVTCKTILSSFQQLLDLTGLRHADHRHFYEKLKAKLKGSWKAQSLWVKLDKRAAHRDYAKQQSCADIKVLVIGSGPCGLRTAIECALLGAKTVVVEKRDRFSRNNVLHLWPYLITDLRNLGAKKFFGKFCAGAIDHISIRQLQCILLKVALLLGVEVHVNVTFEGLVEPPEDQSKGWHCRTTPEDHVLSEYEFNVLIGADGKRNTLPGFRRKEFRGKLAIAVTANFINRNTQAEARVEEISGVAFIFNQKFFLDLKESTRIDLENIVYYKDDTHYFVMTAKKASLLEKGVLKEDYSDTVALLDRSNVNQDALMAYAREAADFSTNYQLPSLDYAVNHYGQADVAMFDFTSMFAAENASRFLYKNGHHLLMGLVGDSLLEPFWPTGSGCARGFLGAFDAAWMIRSWARGRTPLQVLAERESIYTVLSQTTPNYLHKNHNAYSLDPNTRYPNLNLRAVKPAQVKHLYVGGTFSEQDVEEDVEPIVPSKKPRNIDSSIDSYTLLRWCQKVLNTGKYRDVHIVDFTSSWRSGLALCALIHSFRPDMIKNTLLMECDVVSNNQLAFNVAEKELGIPPVLTGEDMAKYEVPDKLTMVAYLSQFYELFKHEPLPSSIPLPVKAKRKSLTRDIKQPKSPRSPNKRTSFIQRLAKIAKSKKRKEQEENEGFPLSSKKIKERQEKAEVELTRYNKLPMEEIANRLQLDRKAEDPRVKVSKVEERSGAVSVTAMADLLVAKFKSIEAQPPPEPIRRTKGQPTLLAASAASEFCSFCHKRVYIMERMSAEGEFFHRGCLKCDHCGVGLRLTNYACDRDSKPVKFYCYRHAVPEMRTRPARKRGLTEESQDDVPELVVTPAPAAAGQNGQGPAEKSPRKTAASELTPLLMPKESSACPKNTPERVEFEISFDGCEEESEEEQFEHNLRASMSSDTLLDDEYSDSESDYSDCQFDELDYLSESEMAEILANWSGAEDDVWENAVESPRHLTLEEAVELHGSWQRQHSKENLAEAEDMEYTRLEAEDSSSTEIEGEESSSSDEDVTEERTESCHVVKSPLSPVSKISASKASFFSEPPTVVSLDPWSMFSMGNKAEVSGSKRNKSSDRQSVSSQRSRKDSSRSTDVSASLELDQRSDDGSLDELVEDLTGVTPPGGKTGAVVCHGQNNNHIGQKKPGTCSQSSDDGDVCSVEATARDMEQAGEGDDELLEGDDELVDKVSVTLAMEQLLRDLDQRPQSSDSSDSGEVFIEGRHSPSASKARKFRVKRQVKRPKQRPLSRSSESEAGRTDPTTTDNSQPHSSRSSSIEQPVSQATDIQAAGIQATDIQAADIQATDIQAAGIQATDIQAAGIQATDIQATDIQATDIQATDIQATDIQATDIQATDIQATDIPAPHQVALDSQADTEVNASAGPPTAYQVNTGEESLQQVLDSIGTLSENSDIDDIALSNIDDRFVTDRRRPRRRRQNADNTSFSISTPSGTVSSVSSLEMEDFAGHTLGDVTAGHTLGDEMSPDPDMLKEYTTVMSLALSESFSDGSNEEVQHSPDTSIYSTPDTCRNKIATSIAPDLRDSMASDLFLSPLETFTQSPLTVHHVHPPPHKNLPDNPPPHKNLPDNPPPHKNLPDNPPPHKNLPADPPPHKNLPDNPPPHKNLPDNPPPHKNLPDNPPPHKNLPADPPPHKNLPDNPPPHKNLPDNPPPHKNLPDNPPPHKNLPDNPPPHKNLPADPPPHKNLPDNPPPHKNLPDNPPPTKVVKPQRKLPELSKLKVSVRKQEGGSTTHLNNLTDHSKPAADHSKPAADHSKPAADHSKPAADHSKPAADHSKPAADHSKPAADHSKPAADHSKPAADHSKPAADHSKPAADHSKPAADHSKPAADHSKPPAYPSPYSKAISPPIFKPPHKTRVPLDKSRLVLGSSSDRADSDLEEKKKISADGIVIGSSVSDDIPYADESEAEEKFYTPAAELSHRPPKFAHTSSQQSKTEHSAPRVLSAHHIRDIQKAEVEKAKQSSERAKVKLSGEVNGSHTKGHNKEKNVRQEKQSELPTDSDDNRLSSLQTSSATEAEQGSLKKKKKKVKTPKKKKKDVNDSSGEKKRRSLLALILPDKHSRRGNLPQARSASQEDLDDITPTVESKKDLAICSVFHSEALNKSRSKPVAVQAVAGKSLAPKSCTDELSDSDESHLSFSTLQKRQREDLDERVARRLRKLQLKEHRQAQQKRLRMAQEIQRQLEEVEVRQRELEERGITVEKALRGDGPDGDSVDESQLMSEWFSLVHEKNALLRYESELNVRAKELELEDRQARLEHDFRERLRQPANGGLQDESKKGSKTDSDLVVEGSLLDELLDVVEQRNTLVAMLEEDRLREQKEDTELKTIMAQKGFLLSPLSYDTRHERKKLIDSTSPVPL
ncbi:protein-methionine sulfoxide oxidase mical3a-like isoform X1 [Physella acuta]|uniref:protein-methionine sulfoxide oxidase mical3a-like isoform X1 n=2 Tax=Physella acuta TaxID=109671 RepID=UPI0027DD1DD9|nr:protein-methionine sulfoxide oxidase mical3a-like isoform X1 [Physella acuta]